MPLIREFYTEIKLDLLNYEKCWVLLYHISRNCHNCFVCFQKKSSSKRTTPIASRYASGSSTKRSSKSDRHYQQRSDSSNHDIWNRAKRRQFVPTIESDWSSTEKFFRATRAVWLSSGFNTTRLFTVSFSEMSLTQVSQQEIKLSHPVST